MPTDLREPANDTPPRPVNEWTAVKGHQVSNAETGRARCACGDSQPRHDLLRGRSVGGSRGALTGEQVAAVRRAANEWRTAHLANAWPILVPRLDDETPDEHARRIVSELNEARASRDRLEREAERSDEVFPTADRGQLDAGVRAAVLKHQYNGVCEALLRDPTRRSADDQLTWMIEAVGDPFDEI